MAIDLTGLSGYALAFAKAMNAGQNYEQASATATRETGGSGLYRQDIDNILKGTGATSSSQGLKYDPETGYVIGSYDNYVDRTPRPPSGGSDNISDIVNALTNTIPTSTFTPPSEDELKGWASTYANTQIDPTIAAIQNSLTRQLAAQDTAKSDVEAAYAGLPAQYANQLEEARNAALESAIARGMGRSGVVDWQTAQYSKPILESQRQTDADKAAKLAAIANTIAALNTTAQDSIAAAEGQRGSLEAARMGDLQQWVAGMQAAGSQDSFNNALQLAGMINSNHNTGQDLLLQLIPLFMGG